MNKKYIFAIVLFIVIGLFVFTFANPNEEVGGNGNGTGTTNENTEEPTVEIPEEVIEDVANDIDTTTDNETSRRDTTNDREENRPTTEITEPTDTTKDLEKAKEEAKKEIEEYAEELGLGDEADSIIDDFSNKIDDAKDTEEINDLVEEAKDELDELKESKDLEKAKEEAKKEIEEYAEELGLGDEADSIIDDFSNKIDDAKDTEEINDLIEEAKEELDELKAEKDLEKAKEEAKKEIEEYAEELGLGDEADSIIDDFSNKIDDAKDAEEINALVEEAKEELDELNELLNTTYVVTFKDLKGNVIETQNVKHNGNAVAPTVKDIKIKNITYTFDAWDKDFTNITENTVVTAKYRIIKIVASVYELNDISNMPSNLAHSAGTSNYKLIGTIALNITDELINAINNNVRVVISTDSSDIYSYVKGSLPENSNPYYHNLYYVFKYEPSDGFHIDYVVVIDLEKAKEDAKNEIEKYADKLGLGDEADSIIDDFSNKIDDAEGTEEINALVEEAKEKLDELKEAKDLEKAKEDAIDELNRYAKNKDIADSYLKNDLTNGTKDINDASTIDEVNEALRNAKKAIDKSYNDLQAKSSFVLTPMDRIHTEDTDVCLEYRINLFGQRKCAKNEQKTIFDYTYLNISSTNKAREWLLFNTSKMNITQIKYNNKNVYNEVFDIDRFNEIDINRDIKDVNTISIKYTLLGDRRFAGTYTEVYKISYDETTHKVVYHLYSTTK